MSSRAYPLILALSLIACPSSEGAKKGEAAGTAGRETAPTGEAAAGPEAAGKGEAGAGAVIAGRGERAEDADEHCPDGKIAYESDSLSPPEDSACDGVRTHDSVVDPETKEVRDVENVYWCCPAPS